VSASDSITSAELAPCCTRALRLDPTVRDIIPYFMLMIDKVRERAEEFDVLHFHIDLFHFPLFRSLAARTLTTLHGRQDLGDLKPFYGRFGEMPLVSISNDQRKPLLHANFVATIHHGVPAGLYRPSCEQGSLDAQAPVTATAAKNTAPRRKPFTRDGFAATGAGCQSRPKLVAPEPVEVC
jgi:hypothetical protein